MGWRREEGRAGQSQHLWVRRTTQGFLPSVMYHRCPSLLTLSALPLQEQGSNPGGRSACWDGPQTLLKAHLGKTPAPDLK